MPQGQDDNTTVFRVTGDPVSVGAYKQFSNVQEIQGTGNWRDRHSLDNMDTSAFSNNPTAVLAYHACKLSYGIYEKGDSELVITSKIQDCGYEVSKIERTVGVVAIMDPKTNTIAIAFVGTLAGEDICPEKSRLHKEAYGNFIQAAKIALTGDVTQELAKKAAEFVNSIKEEHPDAKIILCGHSRGGNTANSLKMIDGISEVYLFNPGTSIKNAILGATSNTSKAYISIGLEAKLLIATSGTLDGVKQKAKRIVSIIKRRNMWKRAKKLTERVLSKTVKNSKKHKMKRKHLRVASNKKSSLLRFQKAFSERVKRDIEKKSNSNVTKNRNIFFDGKQKHGVCHKRKITGGTIEKLAKIGVAIVYAKPNAVIKASALEAAEKANIQIVKMNKVRKLKCHDEDTSKEKKAAILEANQQKSKVYEEKVGRALSNITDAVVRVHVRDDKAKSRYDFTVSKNGINTIVEAKDCSKLVPKDMQQLAKYRQHNPNTNIALVLKNQTNISPSQQKLLDKYRVHIIRYNPGAKNAEKNLTNSVNKLLQNSKNTQNKVHNTVRAMSNATTKALDKNSMIHRMPHQGQNLYNQLEL